MHAEPVDPLPRTTQSSSSSSSSRSSRSRSDGGGGGGGEGGRGSVIGDYVAEVHGLLAGVEEEGQEQAKVALAEPEHWLVAAALSGSTHQQQLSASTASVRYQQAARCPAFGALALHHGFCHRALDGSVC
jgi:hypothetical protein